MVAEKKKTITDQINEFKAGKYDSKDPGTQCDAGWYDWFCRDTSLANKTQVLYKKLIKIEASTKFDSNKTYMFMKNNCPVHGSLYDDFRICDVDNDGDVLFCITPSCGHGYRHSVAQVYGKANGFEEPLVEGTWKDVVAWFLKEEEPSKKEEKSMDPTLVFKARTVTMLEQLEACAKLAYDGELYWSACLILQTMQAIHEAASLNDEYDWEPAADLCIKLGVMVPRGGGFKKRFDSLTAKTCPSVWK